MTFFFRPTPVLRLYCMEIFVVVNIYHWDHCCLGDWSVTFTQPDIIDQGIQRRLSREKKKPILFSWYEGENCNISTEYKCWKPASTGQANPQTSGAESSHWEFTPALLAGAWTGARTRSRTGAWTAHQFSVEPSEEGWSAVGTVSQSALPSTPPVTSS